MDEIDCRIIFNNFNVHKAVSGWRIMLSLSVTDYEIHEVRNVLITTVYYEIMFVIAVSGNISNV